MNDTSRTLAELQDNLERAARLLKVISEVPSLHLDESGASSATLLIIRKAYYAAAADFVAYYQKVTAKVEASVAPQLQGRPLPRDVSQLDSDAFESSPSPAGAVTPQMQNPGYTSPR